MYNGSMEKLDLDRMKLVLSGGQGSGNFGHAGRPGKQGGSAPGSGRGKSGKGKPRSIGSYSSLLSDLKEKGGFSYQPVLEIHAPPIGFIVSPYAERSKIIPEGEATDDDLYQYYLDNIDLLSQEDKYFGGWLSEGQIFLDVSIPVTSLEEANAIAVEHQQRAFWDLVNNVEIKTVWPEGQTPTFHD